MAKPEKPKQQDLKPTDEKPTPIDWLGRAGALAKDLAASGMGQKECRYLLGAMAETMGVQLETAAALAKMAEDRDTWKKLAEQQQVAESEAERLKRDIHLIEHVARHGGLPAGASTDNPTVETVRILASVALDRRQTLEETKMPESGWSSPRARELVEAVPEKDRNLLLGDLLAMLAPHAGETGANETATDTLTRLLRHLDANREHSEAMTKMAREVNEENYRLRGALDKAQSALVARRAPDALGTVTIGHMTSTLTEAGLNPSGDGGVVATMKRVLSEWQGLRAFFSDKPLVALAVKDESTPAVADRFSLLLLEWDGKRLSPTALETVRPWGDIHPRLQHMLNTRLVPKPFR